jgi:pimeloyl-ACP methyl ester carboxylesterase
LHCPVLILHGSSDVTVPIRSAERIANTIRRSGNSGVTVRIILGISHSLLPNPLGRNRSWVYLPAFARSPQLLDVVTTGPQRTC